MFSAGRRKMVERNLHNDTEVVDLNVLITVIMDHVLQLMRLMSNLILMTW